MACADRTVHGPGDQLEFQQAFENFILDFIFVTYRPISFRERSECVIVRRTEPYFYFQAKPFLDNAGDVSTSPLVHCRCAWVRSRAVNDRVDSIRTKATQDINKTGRSTYHPGGRPVIGRYVGNLSLCHMAWPDDLNKTC
jgi:hypothetical protein